MKSAEMSFKSDLTSAENVAINLLKNFNEQRLPKASELEWLVSEEEAPQKVCNLYFLQTSFVPYWRAEGFHRCLKSIQHRYLGGC